MECYKGHEPAIGGSGVDLGYNEEESEDRKLEVEAEVRKLEETLEYQRIIENQAQGLVSVLILRNMLALCFLKYKQIGL